IYKNTIITTMSLDSLIDAFDTYENIYEDNYVEIDSNSTVESSGNSNIESAITFENPIQSLDKELLSDIQLKDHFEQPLIQLTKHNIVNNIQYHLTPIEYPTTANEDIAHIFCIENGIIHLLYLKMIKVCEIADMNIATTPHYNVNPDTDLILHDNNNLNEENQIKTNTIGSENQDDNTSNEEYIIQKTSSKKEIEIMKPFISCDKWHPGKKNHRVQKIRPGCDIELLKDLFENNGIVSTYE
ncbi:19657_t:CDS:2, partial [Racocetra fulgida]